MKNLITFSLLLFGAVLFSNCNSATASVDGVVDSKDDKTEATKNKETNSKATGLKVGDKAADFSLKGIDGKNHSLAEMESANGFIVTFTCNHCPYAVMYEDRLIAVHKKYEALGYPVIAINPNDPAAQPEDSFEKMKTRADEKSFPFLYLFDEGQKVYPKYGATRTPHVFLLDKDLTVQYIGAIDDNARDASAVKVTYLENAINALQKGEQPDPNFTKAIGCSIKKV